MSISPFLRAISLVRRALLGITLYRLSGEQLNCSVKSQKRETLYLRLLLARVDRV
jgi:hypothetical protein